MLWPSGRCCIVIIVAIVVTTIKITVPAIFIAIQILKRSVVQTELSIGRRGSQDAGPIRREGASHWKIIVTLNIIALRYYSGRCSAAAAAAVAAMIIRFRWQQKLSGLDGYWR